MTRHRALMTMALAGITAAGVPVALQDIPISPRREWDRDLQPKKPDPIRNAERIAKAKGKRARKEQKRARRLAREAQRTPAQGE